MSALKPISPFLQQFVCAPDAPKPGRGRPRHDPARATTNVERAKRHKDATKKIRHEQIAVLDTETEPFDNKRRTKVFPFTACLYSDQFETIIIWEENRKLFVEKLIAAIEGLPGSFTIYAHNGGRFDFMFLVHKLRGEISFKGRGIMSARLGNHTLRDSFHLIPEKLAAYQKDVFDYTKLKKRRRRKFKDEIIRYMTNDCVYLFDLVKKFVGDHGLKLSIGQAAMACLKQHYTVERFSDGWDNYVRQFYFGGRVECIRGAGKFGGGWKLIDINSHYPNVMANYQHPIGAMSDYKMRSGIPSNDTVFIDLNCDNRGALIGRTEAGETTGRITSGRFFTTIWEFEVAMKYNLISNVRFNYILDCAKRTDFSLFILPMYEKRQIVKDFMRQLKSEGKELTQAFIEAKKDDMFLKFLLNNSYGKFATNPRRFKEHYITDPGQSPPASWFLSLCKNAKVAKIEFQKVRSLDDLTTVQHYIRPENLCYTQPEFEADEYWIWSKPNPMFTFYNVGTAASITGAARAELLEALQIVKEPIYCDTDSIICRDPGSLRLHSSDLGAWDLEDEFDRVVIAGKKLYSVWHKSPKKRSPEDLARGISPLYTVKSKGTQGLNWRELELMLKGKSFEKTAFGPTLTRYGDQDYMTRSIRMTTPMMEQ